MEKAAKLGSFDLADKNEPEGIWLNNLESLGGGNITQENIAKSTGEQQRDQNSVENKGNKEGMFSGGNIVIGAPIEGYEERIQEMIKGKKEVNLEPALNEDNVLKDLSEAISTGDGNVNINMNDNLNSVESEAIRQSQGIKLTQSVARDNVTEQSLMNGNENMDSPDSLTEIAGAATKTPNQQSNAREMLISYRGYQLKKIENSKAGYMKKV